MYVFHSPAYSFDPGPHPFPMGKYRALHDLLLAQGSLPRDHVLPAPPIAPEVLALAHTTGYVERFLEGRLDDDEQRRLGFRWSPALRERALLAAGGTLAAAELAFSGGGLVANLAGGSHHAFPGHGEGYCAFNDLAVAALALHASRERAPRVAIVDCDVHQGNGTAAILGQDPLVYTLSLHCERNYPAQKVPGTRDAGLPAGTGDAPYLAALNAELDALWSRFRPELVLYQAGVDVLAGDRLGRLSLTRKGLQQRDCAVLSRCLAAGVPAVVVLGGGYAPRLEDTVAAHAAVIRTAPELSRDAGAPTRGSG